jgi:hypothetical protein
MRCANRWAGDWCVAISPDRYARSCASHFLSQPTNVSTRPRVDTDCHRPPDAAALEGRIAALVGMDGGQLFHFLVDWPTSGICSSAPKISWRAKILHPSEQTDWREWEPQTGPVRSNAILMEALD